MDIKASEAAKAAEPVNCPCGSGKPYAACCGPIIAGQRPAGAAEELMRARFTAHALNKLEFLHRTYEGTASLPFSPANEASRTQWTRLVVHSHTPGRSPELAHVDFSAYGLEEGAEVVLHEKAEFVRKTGGWIYTRAVREGPVPFKSSAPKPGRNDPCPCGSGKKYKHCCLNATAADGRS